MSTGLSETESQALEALGYSEAWLDAGLLDRERLAAQHERFEGGGTRKTGKYRAETLRAWVEASGEIADAQIDAFLGVVAAEPDAKVAQAALAELIASPRLGLDQLERIARADPKLVRKHEALIRRTYLARRMAEGVSDELMQQVIESRDASIQTSLVRDARLSRKQAELLASRGANPTIRQNAQSWVQDKKAWR
ncbi:MAG: hypothetical protein QNK04_23890 [Myxococcota bacterium]|nr:hypothetical protein [Myxococcota bacterium]